MSLRKPAFVVAYFALGFSQVLLAADAPNPVGFPKKGDPGGGIGAVRIWYADGAWHLRTSTENSVGKKDKLMVFTGSVRCDRSAPPPAPADCGCGLPRWHCRRPGAFRPSR